MLVVCYVHTGLLANFLNAPRASASVMPKWVKTFAYSFSSMSPSPETINKTAGLFPRKRV